MSSTSAKPRTLAVTTFAIIVALLLALAGCRDGSGIADAGPDTDGTGDADQLDGDTPIDGDADDDVDGDVDTDADTDGDRDGDADTDGDADADVDSDADLDGEVDGEVSDPCEGVICDDPPPDECSDDLEALLIYPDTGRCESSDGEPMCEYRPREDRCASPPASECIDDWSLRRYDPRGRCDLSTGVPTCTYEGSAETCDHPPEDTCADEAAVRRFDPAGICDDSGAFARCLYDHEDEPCTSPPPDECADTETLRRFEGPGRCSEGAGRVGCAYESTTEPCELACEDGACVEGSLVELGINIYVDNFCNMRVDPLEVTVPAGRSAQLTYHNRSRDYEVDVWLSYGGGFLELETGSSWADRFEWCAGDSVYTGYADISTACSEHRLLIHCL